MLTAESPAAAQSALLDTLSTHVTLAREGAVDEVMTERVIRSGDTVATDRTGHAVVTYPDGSTALLEESSELTIEFVRTTAGDYVVRMQQTLGRVWYAVTRTVASGGRYEVRSAAMASVIRAGSGSFVAVLPDGETTVVATAGSVETNAGGSAVTVPAGASTVVSAAGTPSPPGPAAMVIPPATPPPPTPPTTLATPRPHVQTPSASSAATGRAPTPSAAPTSAFAPPVSTLPPLPLVTTMAKVTRTPAPSATPARREPTASARSAQPAAKPTASARATATVEQSQSTFSTTKPTAAPPPATATPRRNAKGVKD